MSPIACLQARLYRLLDLGGLPEPWVGDSRDAAQRWSREYRMRLVEEEIRDMEGVADEPPLGENEALELAVREVRAVRRRRIGS